jgi:hypothetical protein
MRLRADSTAERDAHKALADAAALPQVTQRQCIAEAAVHLAWCVRDLMNNNRARCRRAKVAMATQEVV